MKNKKITILGVGPVGLATAIGFASKNYKVTCYDISEKIINSFNAGKSPIYETNISDFIEKYKENILFTGNEKEALSNPDFVFLCVGTPCSKSGEVDMSAFWKAVECLLVNLKKDCYVIIKSTVPVGTNQRLTKYLEQCNLDITLKVISNPEFLAQGSSIVDTINASRIVIGAENQADGMAIAQLYSDFEGEKIVTTPASAEIIKYAANCYLAMRLSYINDIANVCEITNANVEDVIRGVGLDTRIGCNYFSPGFGYGGSCFPKDTVAFHTQMQIEYGYELELLQATIDINKRQSYRLSRKIVEDLKDCNIDSVTVLGATFKAGTDDIRNSIAMDNIKFLVNQGYKVCIWDYVAIDKCREVFADQVEYEYSLEKAIEKNEFILIATDWDAIGQLDVNIFNGKRVYDGKNCLLKSKKDIKFKYFYIGGEINND